MLNVCHHYTSDCYKTQGNTIFAHGLKTLIDLGTYLREWFLMCRFYEYSADLLDKNAIQKYPDMWIDHRESSQLLLWPLLWQSIVKHPELLPHYQSISR